MISSPNFIKAEKLNIQRKKKENQFIVSMKEKLIFYIKETDKPLVKHDQENKIDKREENKKKTLTI